MLRRLVVRQHPKDIKMRVIIASAVAIALAIGGIALDFNEAHAKAKKRVRQPAYSTSTNCLPQQLRNYLGEVS